MTGIIMESTTIERSMFIRRKETDEAFVERGHKQLLLARVVSLLLVVFARVALARTRAAARRHEVAMDPAAVDKATTELGGRRESDSGERERRDRWTTPGGAQWITQRTRVGRRNAGADAQGQTRRGRGGGETHSAASAVPSRDAWREGAKSEKAESLPAVPLRPSPPIPLLI